MHPILGDRRRVAVYLLAWLLVGLVLAAGLDRAPFWRGALFFPPLTVGYAFVTLSAWYICRAFPLDEGGRRVWNALIVHGSAAVLAGGLWIALARLWAAVVDRLLGSTAAGRLLDDHGPLLFVVGALLFALASAFHYMLIAIAASQESGRRALELSLLAREAELKALRAQIDPHFIFNSLHSISALVAADPAAARRMCLLLADFLRDTLRLGSSERIALREELALAERFLAIEQVRLGPRLQVVRDTQAAAEACLVPPLLLQPLVENAVVHGISQLVEGGAIRVAASRNGPMLRITLENPVDPDRSRTRGVGLGLELLRRRLTTQFGSYESVRTTEQAGVYRVDVHLPAITAGPDASRQP